MASSPPRSRPSRSSTSRRTFLAEENGFVASKKQTKSKQHQQEEKLVSSGMSSKILKQALSQQREIEEEENRAQNPHNSLLDVSEEPRKEEADGEEEDIDDFGGFSEMQSRFDGYEESDEHGEKLLNEIDEHDEKILEQFLSKGAGLQRTLADLKCRLRVGKFLNKYTAGKIPKAFKHIPSVPRWEDVLYLTDPENWSPNAMYQATRIFASNLGKEKVEHFYKLVLLPRVREDIRKHKRLHFALYQSLKKSLYKPAAFFYRNTVPLV